MMTQQTLRGHWKEIRGRLKERWSELSDDDLKRFEGNLDQLVGMIQRKTGAAREQVEDYLEDVLMEASSRWDEVTESARAYLQQASDALYEQYDHLSEDFRHRLEEAGELVRRRPAESVAVIFGAGILAGLCLGLIFSRR